MFSQVGALESNQSVHRPPTKSEEEKGLTLEISHVGPDIRVQGVDDHLAVGGTGDLNTAVDETGSGRGALPGVILTDVLGLGEEVGQMTLVDLGLAVNSTLQESFAGRVEGAVQDGEEGTGILGEDLAGLLGDGAQDGDILHLGIDLTHDGG